MWLLFMIYNPRIKSWIAINGLDPPEPLNITVLTVIYLYFT